MDLSYSLYPFHTTGNTIIVIDVRRNASVLQLLFDVLMRTCDTDHPIPKYSKISASEFLIVTLHRTIFHMVTEANVCGSYKVVTQ